MMRCWVSMVEAADVAVVLRRFRMKFRGRRRETERTSAQKLIVPPNLTKNGLTTESGLRNAT